MRWAVAAMAACALIAAIAGPDSPIGWTAYCAEPFAAVLGFMAGRMLQRSGPALPPWGSHPRFLRQSRCAHYDTRHHAGPGPA